MIYKKACIRCHGDMKLDITEDGPELRCYQCGFFIDQRRATKLIDRLHLPKSA
jgi:DNA-directed RNA polymerase subunit RPC12/RpoP